MSDEQTTADERTTNDVWESIIQRMQDLIHSIAKEQGFTDDQKQTARGLTEDLKQAYIRHREAVDACNDCMGRHSRIYADLARADADIEKLRGRVAFDASQLRRIRKIAGDALISKNEGQH